ncbi:DUF2262 domain-containing protein [Butyrivibrio sp. X503]|uniref:DUF2262 domain-containing protein n=1 Tax=Butyrivibrio sp. X503 TaxID=2364878 RepID=UPI000EA90407|nr:DUF2262 domain-containing protein [Butyrivibrio sp. X503]RKM54711.1 DUF2262 domain-containing protein [Butyrivibrio sp. X503]
MFWFGKKKDKKIYSVGNNFDGEIKGASWDQVQLYIDKLKDNYEEFVTLAIEKPISKVSFVQAAWDNMHELDLEVGLGYGKNKKLMEKKSNIEEMTQTLLEFYNTGNIQNIDSFRSEVKLLPCSIGTGKIPDWEKDNFESKSEEYLVAIGGGSACGSGVKECFTASFPILGYINLKTGKKSDIMSNLRFAPTEEEKERSAYFEEFNKLMVYKIRALAPKLIESSEPWVNNTVRMGGLFGLEMLSAKVPDEFLDGLIEKYKTPVVIKTEKYGELSLKKDLHDFEGEIDWLGEKAKLFLRVERDQESADEVLTHMDAFYKDLAEWDKRLREFAAKELTDLANEWQSSDCEIDDDGNPINFTEVTKADFAKKLSIESMAMDNKGNFSVFYYDGGLFFDHSVVVDGSLENGIDSASMQG